MKKIVPIFLVLIGVVLGGGAGYALRPEAAVPVPNPSGEGQTETEELSLPEEKKDDPDNANYDFVKLGNQFVVPVVDDTRVKALVVLSLSLRVDELNKEAVYNREPMLRDSFLKVLFDHAFIGGFDGIYTASSKMDPLREALLEAAINVTDGNVDKVLITDIVRQDL